VQAVEIEAVEADPAALLTGRVEIAQPPDEVENVGVPPHPGREAAKAAERIDRIGVVARSRDVAVDAQGVGPIGLSGDRAEAFLFDQALRDLGALAIELVRSVRGFTDEDATRVSDLLNEGRIGIFGVREGVGGGAIVQGRDGDGGHGRGELRIMSS
jgi:hypothetical protein